MTLGPRIEVPGCVVQEPHTKCQATEALICFLNIFGGDMFVTGVPFKVWVQVISNDRVTQYIIRKL